MSKRAIAVMAIGEKYQRMLEKSRHMFEWYASRCGAEFIVFDKPLDPTMKHNFLMQKILFPSAVSNFDEAVLMDLDLLISPKASNIFEELDEKAALSATVDNRGDLKYKNVATRLWKLPILLTETHQDYFLKVGFPKPPKSTLFGSVNGGVYLVRPKVVGEMLKELYFNFEKKYSLSSNAFHHEEYLMAYETQVSDIFQELPIRFNYQILYDLYGTDLYHQIPGLKSQIIHKVLHRIFSRTEYGERFGKNAYKGHRLYVKTIENLLENGVIIHFAGGYHIPEFFFEKKFYSK